jgi:ubiquinone/menaquinone biosynthesis C-methylase UbiE
MPLYNQFAQVYARGYLSYTRGMVEVFPNLLSHFKIPATPGKLLDIACGEGTFAVALAEQGWQVTGIDRSQQMLALAEERSRSAGTAVRYIQQDMRSLEFDREFDIATCWFDSLNYMLHDNDLEITFKGIARALKPGGWFLGDMNTICGLAVGWTENGVSVRQETPDLYEVHQSSFDYERMTAVLRLTAFIQHGETWERVDETHMERAYPLEQIKSSLQNAGFEVAGMLGSLQEPQPVTAESRRVWFACQKK